MVANVANSDFLNLEFNFILLKKKWLLLINLFCYHIIEDLSLKLIVIPNSEKAAMVANAAFSEFAITISFKEVVASDQYGGKNWMKC